MTRSFTCFGYFCVNVNSFPLVFQVEENSVAQVLLSIRLIFLKIFKKIIFLLQIVCS